MFCMHFMIKKIILEGFNDRGGANVRGRRGKTSKSQKKKTLNKNIFCFFLDVYWTRAHHILHGEFFLHPRAIWNGPRAWGALK